MGAGLLTTGVLAILQYAYYWFPLTPVGFVVGCAIGDYVGVQLFLLWVVKTAVLQFGGNQANQWIRRAGIDLSSCT